MFIKNIKMKPKLTALFLIVGIIPLILVGWWSSRVATDSLMDKSYGQLKSVREIKKAQIEKFFAEREGDMGVLVETVGTLRQEAFNKLTAVREVKRAAIERYFQSINDQVITFSEDRMVIDAMKQFRDSFRTFRAETMGSAEGSDRMRSEALTDRSGVIAGTEKLDRMRSELLTYYTGEFTTEYRNQNADQSPDAESFFRQLDDDSIAFQYHYIRANRNPLGSKHLLDQADDNSRYSKFHGIYHPIIRSYLEKFGYYDIFLVDLKTGDIVYSVFKELDYSTSLIDGPYAQTNFGEVFRMAKDAAEKDAVFLVDYAKYTPSYEAPASFIASPIFDGDEKVGVALFQMPIDRLNTIMGERAGLGQTGETYLVGSDLLMRSDSYLDPEHHSVIASFKDPARGKVDTEASHAALAGKTETKVIIDYNGNPVLSSYTPVKIGNFTWGLLSEIDVAEAFSPVDTEGHEFYAKYKELYGYYDLFLINPDGYIFYTVEKEPDYQTNILTGTYKDSNLGDLVRRVLDTKQFDIEDFKPYAPSNDAPAAFVAQPLVHNGEVELVIALQLPLEAVNSIMQQREGMGESGETYLVGSDNLMRSDSYLDPENHSVVASFANPEKGSVETVASMEALAGKIGEQIVIDYNGNPVLSAYTPLQVGGITWALLAEIDEAEVRRPINTLIFSILIAGVVISAGVAVLAVAVATGIANPLTKGVEFARAIAAGDLSAELAILQKDEVGILAGAMREMKARIRDVLQEMNGLIQAIQAGKLDTRGNAEAFTGGWREVIVGINNVIDAFMSPFNVAAEYVDRIAKGDLPQTITSEYKGDFNELKNNLNGLIHNLRTLTDTAHAIANGDMAVQIEKRSEHDELMMAFQHMIETITSLMNEMNMLVEAAVEGRLDTRGDHRKFSGDYADIVKGVNDTLDAVIGPLNVAAEYVDRISNGDIPNVITDEYKGDFNDIKNNLNSLVSSTNEITTLAQEIAGGNLRVNVTLRSEHDELMQALEQMIGYLQEVADVTEKISNKNLQVVVQPKSEHDVLNHSLQTMVTTLQTMIEEIERSMSEVRRQNWLRTGQAELGNTMRGEQEPPTLAKNIITYLTTYLRAQVGTIYLLDEENSSLQLLGSYAYTNRKGNRNNLKLGEGLVGQAALEKQSILFTSVPDDYLTISSSLGETAPRSILVSPFMYEGEVKGVIELGAIKKFARMQRDFLNQVSENIAIAFNSTRTRKKMQELLEATQQQAEELQAQQESLRVANEELESQTTTLRESERQLQTQQEELRQTNEELAEQAKALEQQQRILQDKNLELENARQLVEEKAEELEISSKYKSEFLANMSHELRTPLNSLLILSKLLSKNKDGNLTEKQVEFAQTIYVAGTDLLELINEVLDLSKIEAGKMILNIEEMRLTGFVSYIEQHFAHMAEEKGLKLKINLAKSLPATIHTDRQRVEQIIKNLLSNAIKFTSKGGITVDITRPANTADLSHSGLNPQRAVAISVTDTGIGIPEDKQGLIFEAFQQAEGTTSRKFGGTGLGLSITRELTKLLGGELSLQSKEGEGSTFTLYLPEKIEAEPQVVASLSEAVQEVNVIQAFTEAETALIEPPPDSPMKQAGVEAIWDDRHDTISPADKFLLIVEDDPKFAKILFDLARTKEFKCLVASDGAAGLQLAYQYKPRAIILDVGLPGMDGWAVMKKLKSNPDTRHIPVHFISSQDASLDAMKMGAIGFLTKPVTLEMLDETFKNIETAISRSIKKLLIVEDDDAMQKSMLELLGGEDVVITTAKTGKEVCHLLESELFDCMVLDLGLADISGFELLEKIKANAATSYLPIIVYTGKDLTKPQETQLKKHAESIILKGVKSEERLLDEVTLFLHRVEADLPEAQQKKLRIIHDKEQVLSGKTIMMVDDDMRNVFALSNMLEEKGIHVLIGENGKEALDLLTQHSEINLVLMDIMMPEMDGYEVMKRIRKQPKFRKLPIIALTAKAMKGDRQRCIEAGANDYLSKPIDIDKLLSLLRVWLY